LRLLFILDSSMKSITSNRYGDNDSGWKHGW